MKRFPNSATAQDQTRLELSCRRATPFGPFENCHDTIEIAYKLGREAEEAKNKSRYEIYQTRKLMAHAYAWHGEDFDRCGR